MENFKLLKIEDSLKNSLEKNEIYEANSNPKLGNTSRSRGEKDVSGKQLKQELERHWHLVSPLINKINIR